MNMLLLSKVLDLGGSLAGRTAGFPASEREQMRGPVALGLDRMWDALAWPGLTVLEEFTLALQVADTDARDAIATADRTAGMIVVCTDTGTAYVLGAGLTNSDWTVTTATGTGAGEVSRSVGEAVDYGEPGGEIGRVINAWDNDPRDDEAQRVVWEESTDVLFFPDDTLETVWIEYLPPVPDLLDAAMIQSAFEAESVPRFMAGFLALLGAAALHAMDGHYDQESKKLALAETEMQDKITKTHIPARRSNMQVLTR